MNLHVSPILIPPPASHILSFEWISPKSLTLIWPLIYCCRNTSTIFFLFYDLPSGTEIKELTCLEYFPVQKLNLNSEEKM